MKTFTYNNCAIYAYQDKSSDLQVFLAIHRLYKNKSIGGCRLAKYTHEAAALDEVTWLAATMSAKTALSELPFGGAKAVIMHPGGIIDRAALFKAYGHFINLLQGRYVTGCDSSVSQQDMQVTHSISPYVTGLPQGDSDQLIICTAHGVLQAMQVAVNKVLNKSSFKGVRVTIQGVGKVGLQLAYKLVGQGAEVTVTDTNAGALKNIQRFLAVNVVAPEDIYTLESDIFAPCALGHGINEEVAEQLKTKIICGAANNPLSHSAVNDVLRQKNILFIADYLVNLGGAIYAAYSYLGEHLFSVQDYVADVVSKKITDLLDRVEQGKEDSLAVAADMANLAMKKQDVMVKQDKMQAAI
jgi:leucine dehydrogenase